MRMHTPDFWQGKGRYSKRVVNARPKGERVRILVGNADTKKTEVHYLYLDAASGRGGEQCE